MDKSFLRLLFTALMLVLVMMSAAPDAVNGDSSWPSVPEDVDGKWDENDG
ncbi:hypothetical protein MKW92_000290 [Papaver armeniacum]|nr:hypothetical protein MKW92_000290 [Papaver armeniacum]